MDAAVAGLVGVFIGAFAGLGSAWIAQRGQVGQWKLQRRDETYTLLGEWISETWAWATSLTGTGTIRPEAGEPAHSRHQQVEVAVGLHASSKVNKLLDSYAQSYVELSNRYRELTAEGSFSGDATQRPYDRLRASQEALSAAHDALMDQMARELSPSLRRLA